MVTAPPDPSPDSHRVLPHRICAGEAVTPLGFLAALLHEDCVARDALLAAVKACGCEGVTAEAAAALAGLDPSALTWQHDKLLDAAHINNVCVYPMTLPRPNCIAAPILARIVPTVVD